MSVNRSMHNVMQVNMFRVLEGWCPNEMFMHLPFFLSAHLYFVTESSLVL